MSHRISFPKSAHVVSGLTACAFLLLAAPVALAASEPETAQTTMKVSIVDMQTESAAAVSGRAAEMSRDGIVIVFEGVEIERAAEIVRASAADAIAYGYVVRGAILARATTQPNVLVYGIEGMPFGTAIPVVRKLDKLVLERVHELGLRKTGADGRVAATAEDDVVSKVADLPAQKVKCRTEKVLGTRVRKQRMCLSQEDILNARDRADDIQNRGVPEEGAVPGSE